MEFQMLKDVVPHIDSDDIDRIEFRRNGAKPFDYHVQEGLPWPYLQKIIDHNLARGYYFRIIMKGVRK